VTSLPKLPSQVFQPSLWRPDVGTSERTPLLSDKHMVGGDHESGVTLAHAPSSTSPHKSKPTLVSKPVASTKTLLTTSLSPTSIEQTSLPAALLGYLLSNPDALSYGMFIFPASPPFTGVRVDSTSNGSPRSIGEHRHMRRATVRAYAGCRKCYAEAHECRRRQWLGRFRYEILMQHLKRE
jgi:hypothetical protein